MVDPVCPMQCEARLADSGRPSDHTHADDQRLGRVTVEDPVQVI